MTLLLKTKPQEKSHITTINIEQLQYIRIEPIKESIDPNTKSHTLLLITGSNTDKERKVIEYMTGSEKECKKQLNKLYWRIKRKELWRYTIIPISCIIIGILIEKIPNFIKNLINLF